MPDGDPQGFEDVYHRLRRLRRMADRVLTQRPQDNYSQGLKDGLDMAILEMDKLRPT